MAKKKAAGSLDRKDPKKNKSLAIRLTLQKLPTAKAAEIAEAVKKEYGHTVTVNMVYMIKTKLNMAATGRGKKARAASKSPMVGSASWVGAIKTARQLLKQTGSVSDATSLLKALAEE